MNPSDRVRFLREVSVAAGEDESLAVALAAYTAACTRAAGTADAVKMRGYSSQDAAASASAVAARDAACARALAVLHAAYDAARRRGQGRDGDG